MKLWRAYRKLEREDRRTLMLLTCLLPLIAGTIRILGFNRAFSVIGRLAGSSGDTTITVDEGLLNRVRKWTRYLKLNGIYRGNCLSRSLMIWSVLQRNGISCDLVVGTRFRDGQFQAHAWVEHDSRPVNAGPRVRQNYVVFEHRFVPHGHTRQMTS